MASALTVEIGVSNDPCLTQHSQVGRLRMVHVGKSNFFEKLQQLKRFEGNQSQSRLSDQLSAII